MATNKEMMLHGQMTPVVELEAAAKDIDAVARAYKNGQLGGIHLPDGETLKVESAQRETYDLTTGEAEFAERRMSGVVFTVMGRGEHDAVRLDSVGVKTVGAGSVRFVLYELVRNEDGATGTLKPVDTLGEVVMEADGVARLDFDGGCYTDLEEFAVLALSDQSMLCGMAMNGITFPNWINIEDADYYTGGNTEISCTIGDGTGAVWLSWLIDYSFLDYMTIEDFARHISIRMADAEGWIETLKEREALPSTYLVPDGYVPTTKDGEVVWAAQTGGSGESSSYFEVTDDGEGNVEIVTMTGNWSSETTT